MEQTAAGGSAHEPGQFWLYLLGNDCVYAVMQTGDVRAQLAVDAKEGHPVTTSKYKFFRSLETVVLSTVIALTPPKALVFQPA